MRLAGVFALDLKYKQCPVNGYSMKKKLTDSKAAVTAAEIERSIQALNKMAERLWGMAGKPRRKLSSMPWTH
jgi:hypothetical protein